MTSYKLQHPPFFVITALAVSALVSGCAIIYDTDELKFGANAESTRFCTDSNNPAAFNVCTNNAECPGEALLCYTEGRFCVQPCSEASQCPAGADCISVDDITFEDDTDDDDLPDGFCTEPVNLSPMCRVDADCPFEGRCGPDELCHKRCDTSDECLEDCLEF